MKHYRYKLIDFINEEIKDADTKQFYGGDSDTGERAGKPDAKKDTSGDYNLTQIANSVAAAVKSHADAKAKLDAKNLTASGKFKVKAGRKASIAGEAEIDLKTGTADIEVPVKFGGKELNLNIQGLNVTNPKNIYGKDIEGSFIDPETNKKISVGINIDPTKKKYSFTAGEKKEKFSFDVSLDVNKNNFVAGSSIGFNTKDFVPSEFAPKVNVGVEYDNQGGLSGNIMARKDIKMRTGTASISAQSKIGKEDKYAGIGLTYTPDNIKKRANIEKKAEKEVKKYADIDNVSKTAKLKKDDEGELKITKDFQGATRTVKDKLKEDTIKITKKDLYFLIEKLLK